MRKALALPQETLSIDEVTDHLLESAKSFMETDPGQASEFLEKALSISRNAGTNAGIAKSLQQLAVLSRKNGNGHASMRNLAESAQFFERASLFADAAACHRTISDGFTENGNYHEALDALSAALLFAKKSGDLIVQGEILNRTGELYKLVEQYQKAAGQHLKALEIIEMTGSNELLSETYFLLGDCYAHSGELDSAFSYLDKSLSLAEQTGAAVLQARPAGCLGLVFTRLGNYEKGLDFFFRAIDLVSNSGDYFLKADLLKNLGSVYLNTGDHEKAVGCLYEALNLCEQYAPGYPKHEIHRLLASACSVKGDHKKAFEYLNLFHTDFEKIKHQEINSLAKGLQLKSELEESRKGQELAAQAANRQDQLLLNIGHEVRTPLNGVVGMADLLIGTHPTPEQLEYINTIKLSAGNLIHIIDDIIEYNNLQAGTLQIKNDPVNIRSLIREVTAKHLERAGIKSLKLIYEVDNRVQDGLSGDFGLITKILDKLVDNAIKFTSRGTVKLEVSPIDSTSGTPLLLFTISDTGSGIPVEQLESLFEWKPLGGDNHNQGEGGLGLSLALVKKLTGLLGGTIQVSSQQGSGTIFKVTLPIHGTKRRKMESGGAAVKKQVTNDTPLLKILMVEDNKVNQFLAQKLLTKMGFSVNVASSASEAVDALQTDSFDVILMDVQMPVMTGYELTELIRTTLPPPVNTIPIIALTAYASLQEKEKALACGMNDYVTKPYSPEELRSVLLRVADQARHAETSNAVPIRPEETAITVDRLLVLFTGNKEDVISLLNMLVAQIPQLLQEAGKCVEKEDWSGSFQSFHKIKSSINLLKIRSLRNMIAELEELSKDRIHAGRIPQLFSVFRKSCETAVGYLKDEVVKLRKS
jgi:signal transduction histidine kinase/DNA-binding response OmpR family regulator